MEEVKTHVTNHIHHVMNKGNYPHYENTPGVYCSTSCFIHCMHSGNSMRLLEINFYKIKLASYLDIM